MSEYPLIISVSGLRGAVGSSLTDGVVRNYAAAFAEYLRRQGSVGSILLGRDGRASGVEIAKTMGSVLRGAGFRTVDLGVAPTPTVGFLTRKTGAAAGVEITASHNPHPWNGIKLFDATGRVFPGACGAQVKQIYEAGEAVPVSGGGESERKPAEFQRLHLDAVLETVDVAAIRARKYRVLLDSNHGSGSFLGKGLLEALGCEVFFPTENEVSDGQFGHTPEPTEANLRGVLQNVVKTGADVGFCQDPDADRLAVIDETGRYIGEEYTVVFCAESILGERRGAVVTNGSTSLMTRDVAEKYGVPFAFSKVGEANVVDKMLAMHAIFGGEGNGGPMDPRVGYVRDSFVGMARILDLLTKTGKKVSELPALFPKYEIVKKKQPFDREKLPELYASLKKAYPDAEVNEEDGLRLSWPGRWLLVRPSNTEPIVRFIAEARTLEEADRLTRF
ncbi:MAG: phosphoglucosamine mutase [Planctomycetia bacterium]|nr:phosphoglucosamine mutase [Planctomycetia bacterium]